MPKGDAQQDRLAKRKLALAGEGSCVLGRRTPGPLKESCSLDASETAAGVVVCNGGRPGSTASGPKGKLLLDGPGTDSPAHGHCFFKDSWEMTPSSFVLIRGAP